MRKRLVGFCHAVRIFFLLDRRALVVIGIKKLRCKTFHHRFLGTLARIALNALSGGPLRNLAFVFAAIFRRERVRPKHLVVEALPEFSEDGKVEHCDPCVDATVCGDRLVPACLVDTEFAKRGCE